jgi:predicted phosphodiesterase
VDAVLRDIATVDLVVTHDSPVERYPWFPPTQSSTELGILAKALHDRGGDVLWVHGHHHRPTEKQVGNIRYVCLAPTHNAWDGDKRFIDVEVAA